MADLVVEWVFGVVSVSWRIMHGSAVSELPIPRQVYLFMPTNIRGPWAQWRFGRLARSKQFRDAWMSETGGDERELRRFLLKFPPASGIAPGTLARRSTSIAAQPHLHRTSVTRLSQFSAQQIRLTDVCALSSWR